MNIAFTCGREGSYPRNQSMLRALAQLGTVQARCPRPGRLTFNLLRLASQLLVSSARSWDVSVIGFYGQPLVIAQRVRWHGPLVFDAFVSTYDTYCFDRRVFRPDSLPGRFAYWLDQRSCALADIVVLDTLAHARYFNYTFGTPSEKLRVLYVGCDEDHFRPRALPPSDPPLVLFYGTFLPLHGVDVIVRAAHLLRGDPLRIRIIGRGQNYEAIRHLAAQLDVDNIEFVDHVAFDALPDEIAKATLCLGGHFGASEKAGRVIAGKTFQCMAMGKPTIVGDNVANGELFVHGRDVWMVPMNDPVALAEGIRHLLDSPMTRTVIGGQARETIVRTCGNAATRAAVAQIVYEALEMRASR